MTLEEHETSTFAKQTLRNLVTLQVVVLAKFTAPDNRCLGKNTLQNAGERSSSPLKDYADRDLGSPNYYSVH